MKYPKRIPEWLTLWLWRALREEIYPNIRAIAVSFSDDKMLRMRYYLDRPVTEYDRESIDMVMTCVLSEASSNEDIKSVKEECEHSKLPIGELDPLDDFIYIRREY